jgi:hypothetical protein
MHIRKSINNAGSIVERLRIKNRVKVNSVQSLISNTKHKPGLYWIETDMPINDIINAINTCSGIKKTTRKTPPRGAIFTGKQNGLQIIYSGTEQDIQKRLLQHLFNQGNSGTVKMSLKIDCSLFSKYQWYISSVHIKDGPTRYALEYWWRLNVGWPPFCLR